MDTKTAAAAAAGGNCIIGGYGAVALRGRRTKMEDAITLEPAFAVDARGDGPLHFFGVFDGHGGATAARLVSRRLHVIFAAQLQIPLLPADKEKEKEKDEQEQERWRRAAVASFRLMDEEMGIAAGGTSGTTATAAIVGRKAIVVAHCGDSRAVLSRGGRAEALSRRDHRAGAAEEQARVEAAGGRVIVWAGCPRVQGVLSISRALGDRYLRPFVSALPDVSVTLRCPREDEFLVVASDGVWDVLANDIVCDAVRRCLGRGRPCAVGAAVVAKMALARGSSDNIAVVVVDLRCPVTTPAAAAGGSGSNL